MDPRFERHDLCYIVIAYMPALLMQLQLQPGKWEFCRVRALR